METSLNSLQSSDITVVMATYNGEKFINEQIDSILNQTMRPEKIICVDDCSTDSTKQILTHYSENYPDTFTIIHNSENIGSRKSFEKGSSQVTTQYLAFSDQDDWWYPNKLETLYSEIISNKKLAFVYSNACEADENLTILHDTYLREGTNFLDGSNFYQVLINNTVIGCSMLARTDFVQQSIPFPSSGFHHDWYLAIRALAANKTVKYIPQSLFKYRRHANNQVNNSKVLNAKEYFSDLLRINLKELQALPTFKVENVLLSELIDLRSTLLVSIFEKKPSKAIISWFKYYKKLEKVASIKRSVRKKELFSIFKALLKKQW